MGEHQQTDVDAVAREVRRRRQGQGWTLDRASEALGISRRLLVQIEKGEANPSLATLLRIAAGFDVPLVSLLTEADSPVVIARSAEGAAVLWSTDTGSEARLLIGSGDLELWSWILEPGDEREAEAHRTGSREAITVLSGTLTLAVGTAQPVDIDSGHSVTFAANQPHTYANRGTSRTTLFMAVHDPSASS